MTEKHKIPIIPDTPPPVPTPPWKTGVRVLGVSESFERNDSKSIVAGVIMRGDYRIDGFGICHPTVGGNDATSSLLSMYERLERPDIRAWMLGGSIISWFNIIDISKLHEISNIPVVSISYNPSDGIEKYLKEYFPEDWKHRFATVEKVGPRVEVTLKTGHLVFLTFSGMSKARAKQLVDRFTLDGRIPEPVRVARIAAAGLHRDLDH
jgi:endonuclease V-like protein UPF0215 family